MFLRLIPVVIIGLLVLPILAGLGLALLPAFGYLPALGGDSLTLDHWQAVFGTPGIFRSIAVSYAAGLVTTAVSLTVVFTFLATIRESWFDRWIRRLVSPLLSVPHAAAAFGFAFLILPSGLITRWLSPGLTGWERPPDLLIVQDPMGLSLMAGLIIKEIPFLLLMSLAALPQINPGQRLMMARSLGYRRHVGWFKVVAPSLYPLIRLPIYAVLAFASSNVDVAMILGPTLPPTLSVQVIHWFNDPDITHKFEASAGAITQLLVTLAVLLTWWLIERLTGALMQLWIRTGNRHCGDGLIHITGRSAMTLTVITAGLSLLALLINSFAGFWRFPATWPNAITLNNWTRALPSLEGPIVSTILIAVAAALIALILVIAALEREHRSGRRSGKALWLLYLPLIVPQIAFLYGIAVTSEFLGSGPTYPLVIFGHLLFVLPYVFLALSESYRRLDPRWFQVAASLGASSSRIFWRIRLPLLMTPILTAVALGIAISVTQYLPTQLLGAGRITTVTTEAVALSSGGDRRLIGVWAMVQAVLPFIGFMLALLVPRLVWRKRRGMRELH